MKYSDIIRNEVHMKTGFLNVEVELTDDLIQCEIHFERTPYS